MKICVVGGGGAAGVCAIKHCLQKNLDVIGFEQTSSIGGTWVYTDKIGFDEHNLPIHSSMYRSLHTNLPKELMCFPDFAFPPHERSFLPASEVLTYLHSYANTFGVQQKIKFNHHVVRVRPLPPPSSNSNSGGNGDLWEVLVKNLITKEYETFKFDAVLVCNGHFSVPHIPSEFVGREVFKGRQMHSHDYRTPEIYTNERVLVIGGEFLTFIRWWKKNQY
jgi:dimethylaniline monooxygenase (N-oxide forming)